jgi:hypothetical protein
MHKFDIFTYKYNFILYLLHVTQKWYIGNTVDRLQMRYLLLVSDC